MKIKGKSYAGYMTHKKDSVVHDETLVSKGEVVIQHTLEFSFLQECPTSGLLWGRSTIGRCIERISSSVSDTRHRWPEELNNRYLIPLDNNTSDLGLIENTEDVRCDITNGRSGSRIRANGDPDNDGAESFVLATLGG